MNKKRLHVIRNIADPVNLMVFCGAAFIFFDLQYFLMATLPGTRDNMCVDGANLTPVNIIFSVCLSLLVGLMIANLIALFSMQFAKNKAALTSVTGVGMGLGALTLFCPICALPVISLFGVSVGLEFVNDYNMWLKLFSLLMLIVSLVMVNNRLGEDCKACVYRKVE